MILTRLRPHCPACGSDLVVQHDHLPGGRWAWWWSCKACGASTAQRRTQRESDGDVTWVERPIDLAEYGYGCPAVASIVGRLESDWF